MKATTRISKEERRREIIEAATREFAVGGLHGTPVAAIAKRVGVSQPYLFQLFGTKKELFIAAVRRTFERTIGTFRTAAAEAGQDAATEAVLTSMGVAYRQLLDDRRLLLMQMQAYAACADEEIRDVVRDEMLRLVNFVESASGAPEAAIREWLAYGMLMNVVAAMDLTEVDADWARIMCPVTGSALAAMAADAVGKAKRTGAEAHTK
ncbi:MAG: TetR/AcrR family transcriptional regulator [Actinobacteria bacterium]|nr:TetR/AcrR family transcriptional regulator [Actinomycetota bacterium]